MNRRFTILGRGHGLKPGDVVKMPTGRETLTSTVLNRPQRYVVTKYMSADCVEVQPRIATLREWWQDIKEAWHDKT